jgi:hypothetical protein
MPRYLPSMSESANNSIQDVSVVDVYDLASDIGKECEKIIDAYGTESVQVRAVIYLHTLRSAGRVRSDGNGENERVKVSGKWKAVEQSALGRCKMNS